MQHLFRFLITFFAILLIGGFVWFLTSPQEQITQEEQPTIAATIFPLYDIAQNISEGVFTAELILPPGASPHTFEASPSALKALEGVDVIYTIGYGMDDWATTLAQTQESEIVQVDANIDIHEREEDHEEETLHEDENEHEDAHEIEHEENHEEESHHNHGAEDPHYWLTIANAKTITQNIADDLSARYPEHAEQLQANTTTYIEQLDETDTQIVEILADLENKNLVTFHDAWYYFAQEYGLTITGTFEPTAGREPTPTYLAELTEGLETAGTKTIFSEPQFGTAKLDAFAEDNNLTIVELDPLGGVEGRSTFIELMLYNAETIETNN